VSPSAKVKSSIVSEGCQIFGEVEHCVVFPGVYIGTGAKVTNSVIMPEAVIEEGSVIDKAIVGAKAVIKQGCFICSEIGKSQQIAVVAEEMVVSPENQAQLCGKEK
jgi:glucose-1-phosphate adenylyltransferase